VARPRDDRQKDLLRPALEEIIDHPLVRLAHQIDWLSRSALCRREAARVSSEVFCRDLGNATEWEGAVGYPSSALPSEGGASESWLPPGH